MKRVKTVAFIALGVFVLFFVLSCVLMFADAHFQPFWHYYGWFQNVG